MLAVEHAEWARNRMRMQNQVNSYVYCFRMAWAGRADVQAHQL